MGITAFPGSVIVFGQAPARSTGPLPTDYNSNDGPSMFNVGAFIMDPRYAYAYSPGNAPTAVVYGWGGIGGSIPVIDQVPTVVSTNSVAQSQVPASGTALTLTASNTNNVTIGVSITSPETGNTVSGLRAIDGAMTTVTFGSDANVAAWNPQTSISRCVTITVASSTRDDSAGSWTIAGRDIYGYTVTETITGSSIGGTLTSRKAYKYISAITPSGTIASTGVIVGVADVYGLPLFASNGQYVTTYFNNALVVSSTNVTAGQTLGTTATSTTPDVRGTFTSSVASDGSRRLYMAVTPSVAAMATNLGYSAGHGIVGVAQYSSV